MQLEVTFGVMVDRAAAAIASGSEPDLSPDDDFLPTNSHLYLAQVRQTLPSPYFLRLQDGMTFIVRATLFQPQTTHL